MKIIWIFWRESLPKRVKVHVEQIVINEFPKYKYKGVGESYKVDWIRKIKNKYHIDFIGIQESRFTDYNTTDFVGYWGSLNFNYEAVNPTCRYGSLFCIWDPLIFSKVNCIKQKII